MPSAPKISNISRGYNHAINTALTLEWSPIKAATAVVVTIDGPDYDSSGWYMDKSFSSPSLEGTATSYVIPGTFFDAAGEYMIAIEAYNGIPAGVASVDSLDSAKGYNIDGPAGFFAAETRFPGMTDDEFIITVGTAKGVSLKHAIPDIRSRILKRYGAVLRKYGYAR